MISRVLITLSVLLAMVTQVYAVEPDEILDDPVLEARARDLSKQVRCVVCQNQDIDSSNAGVARDLRILVRERLTEGDSDTDVLAYLVARYGDYVLFKPPWKPSTYALWLAPGAMLIFGGFAVLFVLSGSRRRRKPSECLSEADEAEIAEIIKSSTPQNNAGENKMVEN